MSAPTSPQPTSRPDLFARLREPRSYDIAIVGGGATGLGVALDAAARGLSVLLLEAHDFAKGTSSRATKLVHGGVRYLAQGAVHLVREALHERATMLRNAPHLASRLSFVMPSYGLIDTPFYGAGLKLYDLLAGSRSLGPTRWLGSNATRHLLPNVRAEGLHGGVQYWDGQFDDARYALALARTAAREGALLLNYCPVQTLTYGADSKITGLHASDAETGEVFQISARCVVNATGVWVDALLQQDAAANQRPPHTLVAPSQGVHLVVERGFWPCDHALLVPKTEDGRVLFAVPWLGSVILGTTDTPRGDLPLEPLPFEEERQFILREAANYLQHPPTLADVKSQWVGLRPLVRPPGGDGSTKTISREHTIVVNPSGLVTVTGGKWTTYRAMADDVLRQCHAAALFPSLPPCRTEHLPLAGAPPFAAGHPGMQAVQGWRAYGTEAPVVQALPGANRMVAPQLTEAAVRFAARHEYARRVEDVLARRNRLLFLNAAAARAAAPVVAEVLAQETGADPQLAEFDALAQQYVP